MMLLTNAKPSSAFLHEAPSHAPSGFRILCATDLSARSEHSIERALRLSEALGARCMLLHVVAEDLPMRFAGRRAEHAHATLEWHVRRLSHLRTNSQVSVRVGDPYSTIARVAKNWGADLIVLGSHRRRSADTLALSTAEQIAHRARRPVLVVNGDASHDYNTVTFVAPKGIGLYVQLADQFQLFDSAHVSVVPHMSLIDRVSLALSRALKSCGSAFSSKLQQRVQRRTQAWIEEAGLHLMGFDIAPHPTTATLLLSQLDERKGPQLLVARVNRSSTFTRSFAQLTASTAVRTGACDVLLASDKAARSVIRLPGFGEQETCKDAVC